MFCYNEHMNWLKKGFTLVELIVVIAVIGILATVTIVGLGRYQTDTRDANRVASITTIAEALEKYYDANGEYPSCSAITAAGGVVSNDVLKGTATKSLITPQAAPGTTNSIKCETLSVDGTDIFEYQGDGSTACSTTVACLGYTLKYKEEATGTIKSLSSRRNTSIATSGGATVTVSSVSFSTVTLTWTPVQNASSYTVQRCNTASCSTGTTTNMAVGDVTTATVTGLTSGTNYWFRVQPDATSINGTWSNIASTTTLQLATPNPTGVADSGTQLTISWGAIANALSYTLEYSQSATLASGVTSISGITTTNRVLTGLTVGATYYFRLKAVNGALESSWSNINNATTVVPAPTGCTTAVNSNTAITASWGAVTNATSYILEYASNSGFSGSTTVTGITATNRQVTSLANGTTYYFRVKAVNGSMQSTAAACPSAATGVSNPISAGYSYGGCCQVVDISWVDWVGNNADGFSGSYQASHVDTYGSCEGGAQFQIYMDAWYAYSSGGTPNNYSAEGWTNGNRGWWMINGSNSWYAFYNAKVRCYINGQAAGGWSLGTIGGY